MLFRSVQHNFSGSGFKLWDIAPIGTSYYYIIGSARAYKEQEGFFFNVIGLRQTVVSRSTAAVVQAERSKGGTLPPSHTLYIRLVIIQPIT